MTPYSEVSEHAESNLTLVCPKHHDEITKTLLVEAAVREANENPRNLQVGVLTRQPLYFSGESLLVDIGGNIAMHNNFQGDSAPCILMIDDQPIIGFKKQGIELLLRIVILDDQNRPVLVIHDSELLYGVFGAWDIEWVGTTLTIREKKRHVLIRITFKPPDRIVIDKARILCNGIEILVGKDHMFLSNDCRIFNGNIAGNRGISYFFGHPAIHGHRDTDFVDKHAGYKIINIPRHGVDRVAARRFLRSQLRERREKKKDIPSFSDMTVDEILHFST